MSQPKLESFGPQVLNLVRLSVPVIIIIIIIIIATSCRQATTTICPRPGLQWKRAMAALSQAGRARPDQPIHAIQLAGRPPTGCTRQTSDRQTSESIIT